MGTSYDKKKNVLRILGYSLSIVSVFVLSLFIIPFQFFFISAAFVLVALRQVEKELHKIDIKSIHFLDRK